MFVCPSQGIYGEGGKKGEKSGRRKLAKFLQVLSKAFHRAGVHFYFLCWIYR